MAQYFIFMFRIMSTKHFPLIIVGSGPAGLTASIYASRALIKHIVIEGSEPGGQLTTTTEVENWPGGKEALMGPELVSNMREHAERLGGVFHAATVTSVDFSGDKKKLVFGDGKEMTADAVIIATGASAKWLGLESEQKMRGKGVSACATCDGFFFKDKDVVVVGGGDVAMEEVKFLANMCKSVTIVHRRDEFRASKALQESVLGNEKVRTVLDSEVVEVLGENVVSGVRVKNVKTRAEQELACHGVFVAIGHKPNTDFLVDSGLEMEKGYIVAKDHTITNIEGVFAAGDVEDYRYRQAVTAAGYGCMALLEAERYLDAR